MLAAHQREVEPISGFNYPAAAQMTDYSFITPSLSQAIKRENNM